MNTIHVLLLPLWSQIPGSKDITGTAPRLGEGWGPLSNKPRVLKQNRLLCALMVKLLS